MSTTDTTKKLDLCPDGGFERNRYFHDKRMTVRDFDDEQSYHEKKRRLINRLVHGCGVVCGLHVRVSGQHAPVGESLDVYVEAGVALDGRGREIVVCEGDERCIPIPRTEKPGGERTLLLCLEYCEHDVEPVHVDGGCGIEAREHNRVREGWKLRLVELRADRDKPGHAACCALCPLDETCGEKPKAEADGAGAADAPRVAEHAPPTVHDYLAERRTRAGCAVCCGDCVPLATIALRPETEAEYKASTGADKPKDSQPRVLTASVDERTQRKLVYTNPLLFDLVQCYHGDLPRITHTNWSSWERVVTWKTFLDTLKTGLRVRFSQPMDPTTIHRHSFRVQMMTCGTHLRYYKPRFVRGNVRVLSSHREALFYVDSDWVGRDIEEEFENDVRVEVRLVGSLILDRNKRGLDGAALRFPGRPTGNGTQGTDFVSCFLVRGKGKNDTDRDGDLEQVDEEQVNNVNTP